MKKSILLCIVALSCGLYSACDKDENNYGMLDLERGADVDIENHDDLPSDEVEDGKCVDTTLKDEPGECGCQFEDLDIDDDGKTDCPKRVIPLNALPKLEDIPGDCGGWAYPKHPVVRYPKMPEFGYEVTIDTEKYGISRVYDVSKAKETSTGFAKAIKEYSEMGFTRIVVPEGHYPVDAGGIRVGGADGRPVALIMNNDVIVQMVPREGWDSQIINIVADNVYIEGGKLVGDKQDHTNSKTKDGKTNTDEENSGINIWNSSGIFINGVNILSPHGDGVMLIGNKKDEATGEYLKMRDIIIANSSIVDAYRNGIAVVGVDTIRITGNHIEHTMGTAPQFGIDFESGHNGVGIVDHNTFLNNAAGDIVLSGHMKDASFIEYNLFDKGNLEKQADGAFIPWSHNSFVMYRNKFGVSPGGGCSSQLTCTYGGREETNMVKTFIVENDFPRQRIVLNRYNYLCIKNNVSHEGVISLGASPNLRLIGNRVEKYTGKESAQGDVDYVIPKDSVKGIAYGNVTCKKNESGEKYCDEVTKLNEINEKELYKGINTYTF